MTDRAVITPGTPGTPGSPGALATPASSPLLRILPFLPLAAVGIVHVVTLVAGADAVASKALIMPAAALALVWSVWPTGRVLTAPVIVTVVAMAFSWLGDMGIEQAGDAAFVFALGAFLLAHVAYLVAFGLLRLPRPGWPSLVYLAWFGGFVAVLAPHLGGLLLPVAIYGAVLGAMAWRASSGGPALLVGGALFVASDSLIALTKFLPGFVLPQKDALIMISYIAAQGLIAWGIAAIVRRGGEGRGRQRVHGRRAPATAP